MHKKLLSLLMLSSAFAAHADLSNPQDTYNELVDDKGNISFPHDFQTQLVHVGTTAVIAPDSVKVQNRRSMNHRTKSFAKAVTIHAKTTTTSTPISTQVL